MRRFLAFTATYLSFTLLVAWAKPFWHDELFTYLIAKIPRWGDFWSALWNGPERNPPLHYLVARVAISVFSGSELVMRLPFVVAFGVGCACIFLFVRRRRHAAAALTAAVFPMVSVAYFWATDARPYAFVLAGCGVSLLSWQGLSDAHRRRAWALVGLSTGLVVALLSHCYAVLIFIPLVTGELVRTYSTKHVDRSALAAIFLPAPLVLMYVPLFSASRASTAHTPLTPDLQRFVGSLVVIPPVFLFVLGLAIVVATQTGRPASVPPARAAIPAHEWCALLTLAGLPIFEFIGARGVVGFYHFRYALSSIEGLAILLGLTVFRCIPQSGWRSWLPTAAIIAMALQVVVWQIRAGGATRSRYTQGPPEYHGESPSEVPVVVADGLSFLPRVHYSAATRRATLVYLIDESAAVRHTREDAVDIELRSLGRIVPIPVADYHAFLSNHPRFLVWGQTGSGKEWLFAQLQADGARVECVAACRQEGDSLFAVSGANAPPVGR